MSSIIEYYNINKLNYTTASSNPCSSVKGPYNAFDKNDKHFCSIENPYWQVTFEQLVSIESYIISAKSSWYSWYMTQWMISYSLDGNSFIELQTESYDSIYGNTKKFPLKNQINLKSFKIKGIKSSDNCDDLAFNSFDCFGPVSLKKTRNQCSCNCYYYKRRITISILLTLFILS